MEKALFLKTDMQNEIIGGTKLVLEECEATSPLLGDNCLGMETKVQEVSGGMFVWEGKLTPDPEGDATPEVETETVRVATLADVSEFFPAVK